jgi:hypothetical protein
MHRQEDDHADPDQHEGQLNKPSNDILRHAPFSLVVLPLVRDVRTGAGGQQASAGTDMGTAPSTNHDADALVGHPEKWVDFGSRATHIMTTLSEEIVTAFHGKEPGEVSRASDSIPGLAAADHREDGGCAWRGARAGCGRLDRLTDGPPGWLMLRFLREVRS